MKPVTIFNAFLITSLLASSASGQIIHTETGPFGNEMLGDFYRWKRSGVLSIMVQDAPAENSTPTPLSILDFSFNRSNG